MFGFFGNQIFRNRLSNITFSDCIWLSNSAVSSAAAHFVLLSNNLTTPRTYNNQIIISNSTFFNNTITLQFSESVLVNEYSVLVSLEIPIEFAGSNNFTFNQATAVSIGATKVILNGRLLFDRNIGMNGGGVAVYDNGYIVLHNELTAVFSNNVAMNKGPAMYFSHLVVRTGVCFLQHTSDKHPSEWTSSVTFRNNSLGFGLNGSIYVSSLDLCWVKTKNGFYTLQDIFQTWKYDTPWNENVITGPAAINLKSSISTSPGINTPVPFLIKDEGGHNVSFITPLTYVSHGRERRVQTWYKHRTYSSTPFTDLHMSFVPNKTNERERISFLSVDSKVTGAVLPINVGPCPPGLIFDPQKVCNCPNPVPTFLVCNQRFDGDLIYLKDNWIMTLDETKNDLFIAPIQLYKLGNRNKQSSLTITGFYELPLEREKLDDFMCRPLNRTGVLCSQCIAGTSVATNVLDFPCVPCGENTRWRNLIINVLLQTLPALIFCGVISILSVNVLSGTMNGFVLFSQVLTNPLLVSHFHYQFAVFGKWGEGNV